MSASAVLLRQGMVEAVVVFYLVGMQLVVVEAVSVSLRLAVSVAMCMVESGEDIAAKVRGRGWRGGAIVEQLEGALWRVVCAQAVQWID